MLDRLPASPESPADHQRQGRQTPVFRLWSGLRSALVITLLSSCQPLPKPIDCRPSDSDQSTVIHYRPEDEPTHPRSFLYLSQDVSTDRSLPEALRERMVSRLAFHQRKRSEMMAALMEYTLSTLHPDGSPEEADKWLLLYEERHYWTLRSAWSLLYESHCHERPVHPDRLQDFPSLNGHMSAVQRLGVLDRRFDIALAQYALAQISARTDLKHEERYDAIEAAWKSLLDSDKLLYKQTLRELFQSGSLPLRHPRKAPPLEDDR